MHRVFHELKDQPEHWVLTELGEDHQEGGKALRKPDGTFWEVVAEHFFPPGGGMYRSSQPVEPRSRTLFPMRFWPRAHPVTESR
jgi:hypothetical protein